jgi:ribosomal protein S18 acetylase RimI-like enzyme
VVGSLGLAWRVEQACFNAWPAVAEVVIGDWICRSAPGVSRRSNSANPLRLDPDTSGQLIDDCEDVYRDWQAQTYFRVPSLIGPQLDSELDRRGYGVEGDTQTLYGRLDELASIPDQQVEIEVRASDEWLRAKSAMMAFTARQETTYRSAIARLSRPSGFAALRQDGRLAAVAYGAMDRGILCLEGVVTYGAFRGRGLARRMVGALLDWAKSNGASAVCLQVEGDNAPALALYRSLGITTELYRYHYRRGPAPVS